MLSEYIELLKYMPKERVLTMAAESAMSNKDYERLLQAARKH